MEFITKKRISDSLETKFNLQIKRELESAYLYLAISKWLDYNGLSGAAALYKAYYSEELEHAELFDKYLQDRNALPSTPELKGQENEYEGLGKILQMTYDHEVQVSEWISELANVALKEGDLTAYEFLSSMVEEQIDEEEKALYWIDKAEAVGLEGASLFLIDKEMGEAASK